MELPSATSDRFASAITILLKPSNIHSSLCMFFKEDGSIIYGFFLIAKYTLYWTLWPKIGVTQFSYFFSSLITAERYIFLITLTIWF